VILQGQAGTSAARERAEGSAKGLKAHPGIQVLAQQPSRLGKIAVDNALRAVQGRKVESTVKVPVKVVTKENVAGFTG